MLDQIIQIVKEQAGNIIASNPEIPQEKKAEAVQATTEGMATGLKENLTPGNLSQIAQLFSGDSKVNETMNPMVESIKSTITNTLMKKTGLSTGISNGIAATLVPAVFRIFSQKANDPNDKGFNLESLIGSFTGVKDGSGGIMSSLGKLFG